MSKRHGSSSLPSGTKNMITFLENIFISFIYQPFFNLLVVIYYGLQKITPEADMGMAVILFTVVFRFIILPLSLGSGQTEAEKESMLLELKGIEAKYKSDPVLRKIESKKIFRGNRRVIIFEFIDIGIQVLIALMLYRIFSTGLEGADFHLLYSGVSVPKEPFNLVFIGAYDLSKPNTFLNILNSLVIFLAEALNITNARRPATREDKMALFVFPLVAYVFFAYMPAGKKLFVITTLLFSSCIMVVQLVIFWYHKLTGKLSTAFYGKIAKEK